MQQISKQPAFELGQIVATPGALAALKKSGQQPGEFLTRHVNREWGDLSDEDRKENDYSLEHGFRLLSAYRTHAGDKLWIITESDRSVTQLRFFSTDVPTGFNSSVTSICSRTTTPALDTCEAPRHR
jgi:hypothetical protein